MVKCKLHEDNNVALETIKIERRTWKVIVGGQVVTNLDNDGNMTCFGIGREVEDTVKTYMEEWIKKRSE